NHADQSLRLERHGSAGPEFPQEEHGGVFLQEGRRGRRGHDEEGHDRMVVSWRTARTWWVVAVVAAVGCVSAAGTALANLARPPRSARWVDSVLASLSIRDKAAQLVWPQVF